MKQESPGFRLGECQCEEYDTSKTLTDQTRGMWITSDLKGLKKGDVIKIKLIKTTYETHTTVVIDSIIK